MISTRIRAGLICALFACLCAWTGIADAQTLALSNMVVDNQSGRVTVRFGADIKGVEALQALLVERRSLALECKASLLRKRDYS